MTKIDKVESGTHRNVHFIPNHTRILTRLVHDINKTADGFQVWDDTNTLIAEAIGNDIFYYDFRKVDQAEHDKLQPGKPFKKTLANELFEEVLDFCSHSLAPEQSDQLDRLFEIVKKAIVTTDDFKKEEEKFIAELREGDYLPQLTYSALGHVLQACTKMCIPVKLWADKEGFQYFKIEGKPDVEIDVKLFDHCDSGWLAARILRTLLDSTDVIDGSGNLTSLGQCIRSIM